MLKRVMLLVGLLVPVLAFGYTSENIAQTHAEGSMVVTGLIAVKPDGSVYGYSLDHRSKIPPEIVRLINVTLSGWKFTPVKVDGRPVLAKARMSLRIVARQTRSKHFVASVVGAQFGNDAAAYENACSTGACLAFANRQRPTYPMSLARDGVSGTVYVMVEVSRQGRVANAAVRQVDLRNVAGKVQLDIWRHKLAKNTLRTARDWTFNVPTAGREAKRTDWIVTVPVNYQLQGWGAPPAPRYGQWDAYVPGPVNSIPWADTQPGQLASKGSADAIPDNGKPFVSDPRFVLLTPLGGNAVGQPKAGTTGQG